MPPHLETETLIWGCLRVLRADQNALKVEVAALKAWKEGGRRTLVNWRRLAKVGKAVFSAASFMVRHGGMLLAGVTMAWAFVLPIIKWIWATIIGFIGYVAAAAIGVW